MIRMKFAMRAKRMSFHVVTESFVKLKVKAITTLGVFLVCGLVAISAQAGTPYYVNSTSGSDANDGLSAEHPWRTLAKVNATNFRVGDQILFRAGETWRETLTAANHGVLFSSYGSGPRPILSATDVIAGFSLLTHGTNIWVAPLPNIPSQIFVDGQRGRRVSSQPALSQYQDWFSDGSFLFVSGKCSYDPPVVEVSSRSTVVSILESDITIDNLEIVGGSLYGILADYERSKTNVVIENCVIRDAFIDNIRFWGTFYKNLLIESNEITNAGANGVLVNDYSEGTVIKNNRVWGNSRLHQNLPGGLPDQTWSAGIKVWAGNIPDHAAGTVIESNEVFGNGPYTWVSRDPLKLELARGVGIWLDEVKIPTATPAIIRFNDVHNNSGHGLYLEKTQRCGIESNISFDNASTALTANLSLQSDLGVDILDSWATNNVVYGTGWAAVLFGGANAGFTGNRLSNNLILPSKTSLVIYLEGSASERAQGNVIDSNQYSLTVPLMIDASRTSLRQTFLTLANWQKESGQDLHSSLTILNESPFLRKLSVNYLGI